MEKRIYLDIDMDYFVEPIEKESVDNIRLYHDKECRNLSVDAVIEKLKARGLNWQNSKISCFTNHKTSYTHWWISKKQDHLLIHIDAHSDLYRNYNKDLRLLYNGDIACYNYIWYGIRDGYIDEVYWVIPDSLSELLNIEKADSIINRELIADKYLDEKGMHILIQCIVITGEIKQIPIHICTVDQLPNLAGVCDQVTIATSPEFVPAAADGLVFELIEGFGATKSAAQNIYDQHKEMLNKSPEELQAAWKKLKKQG